MITIEKINKLKISIFKVNPALDAYLDVPMFEDKIAAANEILRTVGLPKQVSKKRAKKKLKQLIAI